MKNRHVLCFRVTSMFLSSFDAFRTWSMCCSGEVEKTTMSSKNTKANCQFTEDIVTSIVSWNLSDAFRNSNDIQKIYNVLEGELKAVLSSSFSSISTREYSLLASNKKKLVHLLRDFMHRSMQGVGYKFRFPRLCVSCSQLRTAVFHLS